MWVFLYGHLHYECQASEKVKEARKEAKDIAAMRQHANHVSRTQKDVARLRVEITHLEEELSATGTTKTADDVQAELDALSLEMYVSVTLQA